MDIVMLGHSSAGKTTYVSLMYEEMHTGVGGFGLRAANSGDHKALKRNAAAIRKGRYPLASDQRAVYDLVLRYDGEDVFPFAWRDYRGGVLSETKDSPQAAELHVDLKAADGIVIFCDIQDVATDPKPVRRIVYHVLHALEERGELLTPLTIVLTKSDLVDLDDTAFVDRVMAPFRPLLEAVAATKHVHGLVIPVACGPTSQNVVVPVLWSLCIGIHGRIRALAERIEAKQQEAKKAYENDTFLDRFVSYFTDEPSWRSIAERHVQEARAELEELTPLVEPADQLVELFKDFSTF